MGFEGDLQPDLSGAEGTSGVGDAGESGEGGDPDAGDPGPEDGGDDAGDEGAQPGIDGAEPGLDFDCIAIDRWHEPLVVPPAGLRLSFRVLDCDGDPVPPLGAESFAVVNDEKGEPFGAGLEGGSVSTLGRPDDYALVSVLALDFSDSIHQAQAVDDVIDGALTYLDGIEDGGIDGVTHEVAIAAFGRPAAFEVISPFTTDLDAARASLEALRSAPSRGSTDLYGAYGEAVALAEGRGLEHELTERFVVVLTDGTHEAGDEAAMREQALAVRDDASANIYALGIDGNYDEDRLAELASTAENFVHVDHSELLGEAFERIAVRVDAVAHSNYAIGVCTPIALGEPTLTLEVSVEDPSSGLTLEDAVQMAYPVDELDGDLAACDADAIAHGDGGSSGPGGPGGPGSGNPWGTRAVGVSLTDIELNQGVGVMLAMEGEVVSAIDRNAPVVGERRAIVRAAYRRDPGFVDRPIRAVLTLEHADGGTWSHDVVIDVDADADLDAFGQGFRWSVPSSEMRPGVRLSVALYETTDQASGAPGVAVLPASGGVELGVSSTEAKLRVVLVGIRHSYDGCERDGDPDAVRDDYWDALYATYPVAEVEITERASPYAFSKKLDQNGWIDLVSGLSQLKASDGAPADTYYYGVLDPCGTTSGIAGIGYVPNNPISPASGMWRTGVGITSANTFIHELGHNHGRKHVACSGGESSPDGAYPHPGGGIGVRGHDLTSGEDLDVDHNDFMTYCSNEWISDYGWSFAAGVIEGVQAWADADLGLVPERDVLVGIVHPNGHETWWIQPGRIDPGASDGPPVTFFGDGEAPVADVPAEYATLSDDQSVVIRVPLPKGFDAMRSFRHAVPATVTGGATSLWSDASTPVSAVRRVGSATRMQ